MKHLDDGQLRAHLDGELEETSVQHLKDCRECRRRLSIIEAHARQMSEKLAFLNPSAPPAARWTEVQALA